MKSISSIAGTLILILGCATQPPLARLVADKELMLPTDFPFLTRFDYIKVGPNNFMVLDYDLDGNNESDVRVWYLLGLQVDGGLSGLKTNYVEHKPSHVEILNNKTISQFRKTDYDLDNVVDLLEVSENGLWKVAAAKLAKVKNQ